MKLGTWVSSGDGSHRDSQSNSSWPRLKAEPRPSIASARNWSTPATHAAHQRVADERQAPAPTTPDGESPRCSLSSLDCSLTVRPGDSRAWRRVLSVRNPVALGRRREIEGRSGHHRTIRRARDDARPRQSPRGENPGRGTRKNVDCRRRHTQSPLSTLSVELAYGTGELGEQECSGSDYIRVDCPIRRNGPRQTRRGWLSRGGNCAELGHDPL